MTWTERLRQVPLYVITIAIAFGLSAALVQLTGNSPTDAFTAMYTGSLDGGQSLAATLDQTAPLLIVALGTIICTKAGLFNIGQEGQLIFGAMIGAAVGLGVPGPGWLVLALTLIASAAGGAFWAFIPAVLRYWRRVDVVISTLLLTFVAFQVVTWAVTTGGILRETPMNGEITLPQSNPLDPSVQLPRFGDPLDFNISVGCIMAVVLAVVLMVVMRRTRWGFRLRLLGLNPVVAQTSGVNHWRLGGTALVLSGAFAGLAGGVMLTGQVFRIQAGFSDNVGYEGLLVALVAQSNALVAIPVAFAFGALRSGGGFLATTGVPRYLVDVTQSLIVLAAVVPPAYRALRAMRRRSSVASTVVSQPTVEAA